MTIPPQLLMMLPSLLGGLTGGGGGQGQMQASPQPNLLGGGFMGQGGLMGPGGQALGMNPAFQIGAIPGLMGQFGMKPSPLFGLGIGPGMLGTFL